MVLPASTVLLPNGARLTLCPPASAQGSEPVVTIFRAASSLTTGRVKPKPQA